MLEKISLKLSKWLIDHGSNPENEEIYSYGIECFLGSAITYGSILIIALLMKEALAIIIWFIFWLPLRSLLGGYHASTHWRCYLGSLAVSFINLLLYPYLSFSLTSIIIVLTIITVFMLAPVIHPNNPLSDHKIIKMKAAARFIVLLESSIILIIYPFLPFWSNIASLGLLTASLLAVLGKYYNSKEIILKEKKESLK